MKRNSIFTWALIGATALLMPSCGDFFDQESDRVIYADQEHLNNATDTIYSVTGILNKLQAISDRTILLGELRGDLVDVNTNASSDLRDISLFNIGDDNIYNSPRDYYAIINNCNYFIAKADTALKNNRNQYIFMKEYAAVKAYRAWTYLQLALNYGEVPFVTEPILTKAEADQQYEKKGIQEICNYFINDIAPLATQQMPQYGEIRNTDSRFFYFPIYVLLGDLNLWAGNYREAALCYYSYIDTRNGTSGSYPMQSVFQVTWDREDSHWMKTRSISYYSTFMIEAYSDGSGELITMIPGDSIPSEGNYSELRNIFNSTSYNDYKPSVEPSQAIIDLSAAQKYCHLTSSKEVMYAPEGLDNNRTGDLRLSAIWETGSGLTYIIDGKKIEDYQTILKYSTRNVHIYRRTMVYLRMAEALNRAGFPQVAFAILKTGINNNVMQSLISTYYPDEEAYLSQFNFSNAQYKLTTADALSDENTNGLHSRGSGWTEYNDYYVMPDDTTLTGTERLNYQILGVEDLIMDEEALEFVFEGYRFYDLMRVALRRGDPAYLADRIYKRRGADKVDEMKTEIKNNLYDTRSWYLNWNDQIGLGY